MKELNALLDKYEFLTDRADGKEYTPRKHFESAYNAMLFSPCSYFRELESAFPHCDDRQTFNECGGGIKGALAVIKDELEMLEDMTVQRL